MRVYIANVGSNASHGFASPLFEDGSFEFIPIREVGGAADASARLVRYADLRSHYYPDGDLLRYIPRRLWSAPCHNDPEFETLTYGDGGDNGRSSALTALRPGDALLFIARLERWDDGKRTRQFGFHLIGGLSVDYAEFITPQTSGRDRFAKNAHAVRGDKRFLGVAGSSRSRRFRKAVPITRDVCDEVFRAADGAPWRWGGGKSDLQVIGSYTRSCRRMLDASVPEQERRIAVLRDWVAERSGADDATLLASA